MKLFGTKRNGRHTQNARHNEISNSNDESLNNTKKKPMARWKKRFLIVTSSLTALALLVVGFGFWFLSTQVVPPGVRVDPRGEIVRRSSQSTDDSEMSVPSSVSMGGMSTVLGGVEPERIPGKYTFLVFGLDDSNTDVIISLTFDTINHTMDVVSIPRDTLMNVPWNIRRANSIVANMQWRYRSEQNRSVRDSLVREATIEHFAYILGYKVDYVVMVDMQGFEMLIDAIGGVVYNVPRNMRYSDPCQDLFINVNAGVQRLDGRTALHVVRYRGYDDADIGRVSTQQDLLMTAAEQILENRSSINVRNLATIFLQHVETDLTLGYLLWFGREFLRMDAENINFHMMPHRLEWVSGVSYVSIILDEWLDLVNNYLSPWTMNFAPEDVSIVTRGSRGSAAALFVTDGVWAGSRVAGGAAQPAQQQTPPIRQDTAPGSAVLDEDNVNGLLPGEDAYTSGDTGDVDALPYDDQIEESPYPDSIVNDVPVESDHENETLVSPEDSSTDFQPEGQEASNDYTADADE